jgi:hypothetical protein
MLRNMSHFEEKAEELFTLGLVQGKIQLPVF